MNRPVLAKQGLSISQKLLIAFLSVVLVLSFLLATTFFLFSKNSLEKHAQEQLHQSFIHITAKTFERIHKYVEHLKILEVNPILNDYLMALGFEKKLAGQSLERLFREDTRILEDYISISFIDYSGKERITICEHECCQLLGNKKKPSFFQILEKGKPKKVYFYGPEIRSDGHIVMQGGIHKTDPDIGEFAGAVVSKFDLTELFATFSSFTFLGENITWIYSPQNEVLIKPNKSSLSLDPGPYLTNSILQASQTSLTDKGLIIAQDINYGDGQPIFRIVFSVPKRLLLRDLYAILKPFIYIVVTSIIFVALLAVFFARYLSKPIKDMVKATAKISDAGLSSRVNIKTSGELQVLTESFNQMLDSLEKTTDSKEFVETVLNSINDPIVIVDADDYRISRANEAFIRRYSVSENKIESLKCYEVLRNKTQPCSKEGIVCLLEKAWETGNQVKGDLVLGSETNPEYFEVTVFPIKDAEGTVKQAVRVSRDITDRKIAEINLKKALDKSQALSKELSIAYEELQSAQDQMLQREKMASIGQLAAGVAHEINNPTGFISSNLGTLKKYANNLQEFIKIQNLVLHTLANGTDELEKLKEDEKKLKINYIKDDIQELIDESIEGADRIKNIVMNLKSFSRVDEISKIQRANINKCIEDTLTIVWNELKYKAQVNKEFGDLPETYCYVQQMTQIFMNLLVNAVHAIETKGEINIKTWHDNGAIYVSVTDTGCGIPEEIRSRIFDPFFTTKEVGKGTGLGMSIVYEIIKKHNGDLTLESTVGKGTTFTIQLPVVEEAPQAE